MLSVRLLKLQHMLNGSNRQGAAQRHAPAVLSQIAQYMHMITGRTFNCLLLCQIITPTSSSPDPQAAAMLPGNSLPLCET